MPFLRPKKLYFRTGHVDSNVKMDVVFAFLWLLAVFLKGILGQGVYGKNENVYVSCKV